MTPLTIAATLAALTLPFCATAQEGPMPATSVTPDSFVTQLGGNRIRTMYEGIEQEFLFELQDRDVQNLFNYGFPPSSQTLGTSDLVVVVKDSWGEAADFWRGIGISAVASDLAPYVNMSPDAAPNMVLTILTAPDGHPMRVYNFTSTALGEDQSQRCMARRVIDETYRGEGNSSFNSFACSQALR
ncbi:hypothetical protein [Pseudooctadecabacter sp.]|uniref:hypothetical protein n=1 Tax=Pseudooctadecabacter sp. TaxID=1966338 RepID=UPI0035C84D4E